MCVVCVGVAVRSHRGFPTHAAQSRHDNQIEDFEIARREHYDHKRSSNSMYWMAFTLIMRRAKGENTRYLDFFVRKVAAEQTYVCCLLEASPCLMHHTDWPIEPPSPSRSVC